MRCWSGCASVGRSRGKDKSRGADVCEAPAVQHAGDGTILGPVVREAVAQAEQAGEREERKGMCAQALETDVEPPACINSMSVIVADEDAGSRLLDC